MVHSYLGIRIIYYVVYVERILGCRHLRALTHNFTDLSNYKVIFFPLIFANELQ